MPSNEESRRRLADRARPPRDGRDGLNGRDGSQGRKGDRGERGERGTDGEDGRDAALVNATAFFVRDDETKLTLRLDVEDEAGAPLLSITPMRDGDGLMVAASIIKAP
jgi:hypothetical protein